MAERKSDNEGSIPATERAEIKRRVDDLDRKLDQVRADDAAEAKIRDVASKGSGSRGMAQGLRMASELVAAVIIGGLIGYGLDYFLGTRPWLFLAFFFLGFAAGVMNVLRAYKRVQEDLTNATGGNIGKPLADDDD